MSIAISCRKVSLLFEVQCITICAVEGIEFMHPDLQTPVTLVVLVVTFVVTGLAFRNRRLWERLMFKPREILADKQYERMLTSGFVHGDWMHFGFNAYSFLAFARAIERIYGATTLLVVYFSAILGGSLLSLLIHRHHDYRAVGASGGVCGVIFASVFLLPGGSISLIFIPIGIPAYLYAILFLVLSFVMMRRGKDNIGHDAHIGGAIIGLLVATAMYPDMMSANPAMYAAVIVLSLVILLATVFDPLHLLGRNLSALTGEVQPRGNERFQRYDDARKRNAKLAEIDRLLDKVSAEGIQSLSRAEREKLDQLSKEFRDRR